MGNVSEESAVEDLDKTDETIAEPATETESKSTNEGKIKYLLQGARAHTWYFPAACGQYIDLRSYIFL